MRERYWAFYFSVKYESFYYRNFQLLFNKINWMITAFLAVTTLSCIAAWDIWQKLPALWATLICVSQIVQALFPRLPYNDLLISTKFIISTLSDLLLEIDHDWLSIDIHQLSDEDISSLLEKRQKQHSELTNQFFAGTCLPDIKYCKKRSERDLEDFFSTTYPCD